MADPRSWFSFGAKTAPPSSLQAKLTLGSPVPLVGSTPDSPGVATPSWDVEKDTNSLFREHGVKEIKQIEQQTRLDIDRRREDLRQMVGERYRDLIDAADSIVDMQKCSEQVKHSVEHMESLCQKLQQTHFLRGAGGMRGPLMKNEMHEMATQLKLLAECPEKVWVCLEAQRYLEAAQHFLLARHIYSQLGLGVGGSTKGAVSPGVVQKLWQSVSCFKETILECCNCHLQCSDLEEGPMVQSLCTIVLLEGCSSRQAFTQFLLARKAAIQSVFHSGPGKIQHRSVKNQICHLVKTILHSLLHIEAIFCQHQAPGGKNEPSLLLRQLLQFSQKGNMTKVEGGLCSNLIPKEPQLLLSPSVTGFSPSLRSTILTEIPATDIHHSTEDWITMCAADIQSGVGQLLQHVTSIKAISSIKCAIHSLLAGSATATQGGSDDESPDSTQWMERWSQVCHLILNRELSIWDTFFAPVLLQRIKLLLDKRFSAASSHASTQLSNLLNSIASDPARYHDDIYCHTHLWKEEVHPNLKQSEVKQLERMMELTLKCKACTPNIYSFCQSLGGEFDGLIEDLSHYIQPSQSITPSTPTKATITSFKAAKLELFPFPLYADTADIQDYIQQSAVQWIKKFLQNVDAKVAKLHRSINDEEERQTPLLIDRLLVIGRLCQCLLECTQSLSHLATGAKLQQQSSFSNRSFRGGGRARTQSQQRKETNGTATSAADMLHERANSIFGIWADWTSCQITNHLRSQLSSELHLSVLASSLVWNEITVSEEAESGKQVSSVIQVPSQASTYVTSFLFTLSREISRVGGHMIDRSILQHLSRAVLVEVVKTHEEFLKGLENDGIEVPQQCALQLFYNLRFVASILVVPKEDEEKLGKQLKSVMDALQSCIDPFDLDVFTPYILANLETQLSRSSVMLGMLLALRGSLVSSALYKPQVSGSGNSGMGQDKHMVLPLAPSVGRIPFLPLSTKTNQPQIHKVISFGESTSPSSLLQTLAFFHHL